MQKRNYVIILTLVTVLVIGAVVWALFGFKGEIKPVLSPKETVGNSANTLDIGLTRAKSWSPDAKLSYVESGKVEESTGLANDWNLTFTSDLIKGKAFLIKVSGGAIVSAEEKSTASQGAVSRGTAMPENMMTQQEAIERVKKMPGYENAEILSVEAVYGQKSKSWYWGVKTSRGTVSIEAK